jgi:hypothetical protein
MYPNPRTVLSIGGLRRGDAQDEAAAADHTANIGRGSEAGPGKQTQTIVNRLDFSSVMRSTTISRSADTR